VEGFGAIDEAYELEEREIDSDPEDNQELQQLVPLFAKRLIFKNMVCCKKICTN
jgi:hypothetical protein